MPWHQGEISFHVRKTAMLDAVVMSMAATCIFAIHVVYGGTGIDWLFWGPFYCSWAIAMVFVTEAPCRPRRFMTTYARTSRARDWIFVVLMVLSFTMSFSVAAAAAILKRSGILLWIVLTGMVVMSMLCTAESIRAMKAPVAATVPMSEQEENVSFYFDAQEIRDKLLFG